MRMIERIKYKENFCILFNLYYLWSSELKKEN